MKPNKAIILAAMLAIFLWAQAFAQTSTPAAPADKADACACCNHDKADAAKACEGDCCKSGKCEGKDCCKGGDCAKMAKDGKSCCDGKDGKSCPMMAKGKKGEGCCGKSCMRHGEHAAHASGK